MSTALLGNHFDIHGGGADLKFPHHENEIAQSEGATGEPFVNVWMHNGFVRVNEEKMSKSLGNFFTVREVLDATRPEEVRYFILTSQYRSPLNYDDELDRRPRRLTRLYTALRGPGAIGDTPVAERSAAGEDHPAAREAIRHFGEAMDDDLNTPEAIAALQTLARELNTLRAAGQLAAARELAATLRRLARPAGAAAGAR